MAIRVVSFHYKAPDPYPDTIMIVVVLGAFACLIRWRKNLLVRRQIAECINDVFIVVSIYNLTVAHDDSTLWTALLSSSLGYLLPNPSLKR